MSLVDRDGLVPLDSLEVVEFLVCLEQWDVLDPLASQDRQEDSERRGQLEQEDLLDQLVID